MPAPNARPPASRRAQAGVSLLELVFALAILLVIAAISTPNVQGVVESQKLQTATSMLASKLNEARMNALRRNRAVRLELDPVAGRAQIRTDGPGGLSVDLGTPGQLPAGVVFVAPVPPIAFDALARPVGGAAAGIAVEITRTGARRAVEVTGAGAVLRR